MRTYKAPRRGRVEIYRDAANKWRWRVIARNGKTLAVSSESYSRLKDAITGVNTTAKIVSHTDWHNCEVVYEAA